jgi:hypothetical protein
MRSVKAFLWQQQKNSFELSHQKTKVEYCDNFCHGDESTVGNKNKNILFRSGMMKSL